MQRAGLCRPVHSTKGIERCMKEILRPEVDIRQHLEHVSAMSGVFKTKKSTKTYSVDVCTCSLTGVGRTEYPYYGMIDWLPSKSFMERITVFLHNAQLIINVDH